MKQHHYKVTVNWTGNEGQGTTTYRAYNRNHTIIAEGKYNELLGSSDPAFLGDATRYNPEDLFLASLSACHMLWYLHLCTTNHIIVTDYKDHATGIMDEEQDGRGKFSEVTLFPEVTITNPKQIDLANSLHKKANEMCFIANSCNFVIHHKPIIITT
ncbi:peroxiredoxin [Neptunitalea chrysea]|uniref:Peroxiredoxin n=1 Tax=Neptunitalea chrysea TaxID=1647581 RepID=A0A9W6B5H1_9FLAO|nr:OsmC family protein [Neptunitalea chrysea]GLB52959.1 peroxiredoxin [Neptunitalea chrysea]